MAYKYLYCVNQFGHPNHDYIYVPIKEVLSIEPVNVEELLVTLLDNTKKAFTKVSPSKRVPPECPIWISFKKWYIDQEETCPRS